ncbi:hypothetical protein F8A86_08670 [Betaproteobacteria bacterium SCN1]|jgi:hypothetical protein|nr:hypothetical protein F8A86_08670 [Betaproteobacteria bacterium SCN1]
MMSIEELPYTPEFLLELGFPAERARGRVFQYRRTKLMLIAQWEGHGPDTCETLYLFESGFKFPIRLRQKARSNGKIFTTYEIRSQKPLRPHEVARLKMKGGGLLAAYSDANQFTDFDVAVTDETKPIKPRPIARLKKLLKIFEYTVGKAFYRSPAMEAFIPGYFTVEEAKVFAEHIQKTDGKGIPLVSLLVFELAFEKYKSRAGKSAGADI